LSSSPMPAATTRAQGAYVCARREDRQDRVWEFFLVPRAEGDAIRGPLGATPLNMLNGSTWKTHPAYPSPAAGPGRHTHSTRRAGCCTSPAAIRAPDYAIGVRGEGGNLYTDSLVVLDAKTGDYKHHFKIVPEDWHDWDVSNPPILIETKGGKQLLALAPKDGHLYGFDRATNGLLYRVPATRMENIDEPFVHGKDVHFCPGAAGGAEWNSPAYDPQTNLILVGEIDWCTSVNVQDPEQLRSVEVGQLWCGEAALNPFNAGAKLAAQTATGPDGFLRG
jgi:alcohol dehydrogenase (cytochrome c)